MTQNETLVYTLLCQADRPLSAYNILDALRDKGIRAPLQVYRALGKLVERGAVHRIESVNGFVACQLHDCGGSEVSIFMLCTQCERANEFTDASIDKTLQALGDDRKFQAAHKVIEITGLCADCRSF
ncbi:MAG: Fur family transcriptional regulator [Proteobacteria bacterium]|jgi:Fur family zinc uptake transcriptional regulator|nr:Fur family transcriptional regulator [Pseudomonadota bacterium]MDA0960084.1 Fur family transcriptional regulator [Pseudomonadota bacterium]MDA1152638.1 Fur family transcriptional regulator [Pseudomonadota bacterium]